MSAVHEREPDEVEGLDEEAAASTAARPRPSGTFAIAVCVLVIEGGWLLAVAYGVWRLVTLV